MAKEHEVELSEFLSDQPPQAFKGLVSAPIAWRVERLLLVARSARELGSVGAVELLAALLHAQEPNAADLAAKISAYRKARVWETRASAGDVTDREGKWRLRVRGPGEKY